MVRTTPTNSSLWRSERLGLTMIGTALLVIVLVLGLFHLQQSRVRHDELRSQGLSLARLLAEIPLPELLPADGRHNVIKALYLGQLQDDIAYASIRGLDGRMLSEVATPGVRVPDFIPVSARDWLRHRDVGLADGRKVFEVQAPLFAAGEQAGSITLGMFYDEIGPGLSELPFAAGLALVIFMLAPVAYIAMRRELRPLRDATEQMTQVLDDAGASVLEPSRELSDFMGQFSSFMQQAQARIVSLQNDNTAMLTSTKLISYSKARVESVLESLPEALLVLDETGAVSFVNSRIEAMFGVSPSDLQGATDLSWCPDAQVCQFLSHCAQSGPGGYVANAIQFTVDAMPGKTFAASAYPLFSPNDAGSTLGTLVVFRDVTVEALACRSRGEFVAHVAHELKTPLNVLGMYSELLLESGAANEAQRIECVNVIRDEVERLASLVRNLLSMTQIEMGSLQPALQPSRITDLLNDVFAQIRDGHSDHDLNFHAEIPAELGLLNIDKDLLRVALTNLLTNAIKYNRPGGTVRMTARELDDEVQIAVQDDGIGIAEKDQAQIFDKFFRSEDDLVRERSGHGLGLSLTRDIVALHGAEIEVNSEPGEGSEFVIRLRKEAVRMVS